MLVSRRRSPLSKVPRSLRRGIPAFLLGSLCIPAAILAGCGGQGGDGSADVGPAEAVPANTPLYIDATVRPTGSAEAGAKAAAGKILGTSDPGSKITSLIDKSVTHVKPGETFTYQKDVAPWLGEKVAIFYDSLQSSDPTIVAESTDNAAALMAQRKNTRDLGPGGTYKGHPYDKQSDGKVFGTLDGFVVSGPLRGFQQAVDEIGRAHV